ncbi:hypothetical protein EN844_24665 [Mesorhizobium sp. M3A.F.Ca.ET.201.01.1.1]|uniref:hypothetical protein n=1 Tax=Mesorhizobium sp. M3A.F.Ca.ET.201.01.1.1 TaxID=2563946 RepID=UPI0010937630|nr:hypothetical protein [Mesorhizobium sp. M3A.F.Ca.ET.201.01.1.1]TGS63027.1 hypothetical protein EN844_24665 [Mesorhizobium sp. M3A.F.Ca.ET.201.01.1.1]
MKPYKVEVMSGEVATSYKVVRADTPSGAATKATGRAVRDRRSEIHWVRVTDEDERVVFKYAFS